MVVNRGCSGITRIWIEERMLCDHTNLDSDTMEMCDVGYVTEPPQNSVSPLVV